MADVLIRHPLFGSLWLHNATITDKRVVGQVWDNTDSGSSMMPDDYRGQYTTMNFPVGCIRTSDLVQVVKCSVPAGKRPFFHFCNNPPKLTCLRCEVTLCHLHSKKHQHYEPKLIMVS